MHHPPQGPALRGCVLYLHPFAEEMNKARRMAALQSRALAAAGYEVLQIDLQGCGDSAGHFGDASWAAWLDDAADGAAWLQQRGSAAPLWLWGLRAGCLLAAAVAPRLETPCHFVFWQPSFAGKAVLQQFLRLRLAADMASGQGQGSAEALRGALAAGTAVEIAGYMLAPGLASGLEKAVLAPPATATRLEWLEVSASSDATLLPASTPVLERWRQAGFAVRSQVVTGPQFWQTTEIEEAPALCEATLLALQDRPAT